MELSATVLYVIGFTFASVSAFPGEADPGVPHGDESFGLLNPDGSFKHDSMKQWDIILKRLEKYTEPSGHSAWQKWWDAQKGYDDYSNNNDMPDLTEQFRGAVPVLNELAPHLKGSFLPNALRKVATECAELVKKLDNGGTMKDIDAFLVIVSREMNKAMDATPL